MSDNYPTNPPKFKPVKPVIGLIFTDIDSTPIPVPLVITSCVFKNGWLYQYDRAYLDIFMKEVKKRKDGFSQKQYLKLVKVFEMIFIKEEDLYADFDEMKEITALRVLSTAKVDLAGRFR